MPWVEIDDYRYPQGWDQPADADEQSRRACRSLEEGKIVYFPNTPFDLSQEDRDFLLSQKQSGFKGHKNISYRPTTGLLRGASNGSPEASQKLHDVMRRFFLRSHPVPQ